jgi:hypothetical protein
MSGFLRLFGIVVVYVIALAAWLVLGGVTQQRTATQSDKLNDAVSNLWGAPQTQAAPELTFFAEGDVSRTVDVPVAADATGPMIVLDGQSLPLLTAADGSKFVRKIKIPEGIAMSLASSALDVKLHSDPRRKGLVWYSLYDVRFDGTYAYEHQDARAGELRVQVTLPSTTALFDDLVFEVNGADRRDALEPKTGVFDVRVPVKRGDKITFRSGYKSRGADDWTYRPAAGVQRLENFTLKMHTDFEAIDFPERTLSPSTRTFKDGGWELAWLFRATVTGQGMGMTMPRHVQPGELAAALSFSAPVSLLFFFVVLFVLATLRGLDIHPINYLFIACAFFAFHLLFAYSVDRLPVPIAFALCSVVSMGLVVSYLRLVVSTRFALRETAAAQLLYLIVFSLAHLWDGYTGLTITVLAISTLFVLMQMTGRIQWSDVLGKKKSGPQTHLAAKSHSLPVDGLPTSQG